MLKKILRENIAKTMSVDQVVHGFLRRQEHRVRKDLKDVIGELVLHVTGKYGDIPKGEILEGVSTVLDGMGVRADLTALEAIYINTATEMIAGAGLGEFVFDKVDNQALNAIRKNFFWLGDNHSAAVRERLYDIVESAFKGDVPREKLAEILLNEFGTALTQETRYFKDVADHIISQGQNLARVRQGQKHGVKNYRVKAVMDKRTSKIYRSMNGRIISAAHLETQCDKIQAATNIDEKKAAAGWRNEPFLNKSDKLPANFGLPPYHFRCRTILQPVWLREREANYDGETVRVRNGGQRLKKGEIFRHQDKTGVERVVTQTTFRHSPASDLRVTSLKDTKSALNSINRIAPHKDGKRTVATSQNDFLLIFEGDRLITLYKPDRPIKKAFGATIKENTQEVVKWHSENFISGLIKGLTGTFATADTSM